MCYSKVDLFVENANGTIQNNESRRVEVRTKEKCIFYNSDVIRANCGYKNVKLEESLQERICRRRKGIAGCLLRIFL